MYSDAMTRVRSCPWWERLLKAGLFLCCITALYFQHDIGIADNGDYTRSSDGVVSFPADDKVEWLSKDEDEDVFHRRYVDYYIPYWRFESYQFWPGSSVILLWLPGIALNRCMFSSHILCGSALSLFPKLLLVGTLWLLFRWIDEKFVHRRGLFLLLLGLPYALIISSSDYVSYLNTFYRETASFVFAILFFAALVWLIERPRDRLPLAASLVALFLLATAKANTVYWPVIGLPAILAVRFVSMHREKWLIGCLKWGLFGGLVASAIGFALVREPRFAVINNYDSLFVGALPFSDDPAAALESLGLEDGVECVGKSAFLEVSQRFLAKHGDQMSFLNTARVVWREPMIAARMLLHLLNTMHIVSNPNLGRFPYGDPRIAEHARPGGAYDEPPYTKWYLPNVWALAKHHAGPRGLLLLAFYAGLGVICLMGLRREGPARTLSIIGLLSIIACFVDMIVAVVGDGIQELPKHMFLANVMFDFALVASVGAAVAMRLRVGSNVVSEDAASTDAVEVVEPVLLWPGPYRRHDRGPAEVERRELVG